MSDCTALSQNEIESLCMKAARGAGFSWGLAEEAGVALGILAAQGIDGTAALLQLLVKRLAGPEGAGHPTPTAGRWHAADQGLLCPITLGAALLDCALLPDGPFAFETKLDPVAAPVLLVPFLLRGAALTGMDLMASWQDGAIQIAAKGGFDRAAVEDLGHKTSLALTLRPAGNCAGSAAGKADLPRLGAAVLDGLDRLALRTTVPPSEVSRRGAGSASADND